ncbi:hypothetical protein V8C37DRAFT_241499 [Trichoderma ceciliae]
MIKKIPHLIIHYPTTTLMSFCMCIMHVYIYMYGMEGWMASVLRTFQGERCNGGYDMVTRRLVMIWIRYTCFYACIIRPYKSSRKHRVGRFPTLTSNADAGTSSFRRCSITSCPAARNSFFGPSSLPIYSLKIR